LAPAFDPIDGVVQTFVIRSAKRGKNVNYSRGAEIVACLEPENIALPWVYLVCAAREAMEAT